MDPLLPLAFPAKDGRERGGVKSLSVCSTEEGGPEEERARAGAAPTLPLRPPSAFSGGGKIFLYPPVLPLFVLSLLPGGGLAVVVVVVVVEMASLF